MMSLSSCSSPPPPPCCPSPVRSTGSRSDAAAAAAAEDEEAAMLASLVLFVALCVWVVGWVGRQSGRGGAADGDRQQARLDDSPFFSPAGASYCYSLEPPLASCGVCGGPQHLSRANRRSLAYVLADAIRRRGGRHHARMRARRPNRSIAAERCKHTDTRAHNTNAATVPSSRQQARAERGQRNLIASSSSSAVSVCSRQNNGRVVVFSSAYT